MKKNVVNIMNEVHIDVVDGKVKIVCNPERKSLPIDVVEEIVTSVIKQAQKIQKEEPSPELVKAVAEQCDAHLFDIMRSWQIVSFILAAIIVGLLIFWR